MSKLVPNVTDTARIFRGQDFTGKFETGHGTICLVSPYLGIELFKREPKGRFFADRKMIALAGGPWFMREYKSVLEAQLSRMSSLHMIVRLGNIEARDLFSYQNCMIDLELNHNTRRNPIALQLVQKAMLFSICDEVLARQIESIA